MRELCSAIWMSCKDLRHDLRMTICLILTVASITVPLLLFFGLKNGVIEVMRQRMINDPSYMEIIPQGTSSLDTTWFEEWRKNPHLAFLVPKTRELGVSGTFKNLDAQDEKQKTIRSDMQPTGEGDWLLKSYHISIPNEGSCVLTTPLAEKLKAEKNHTLEVSVSRQKKGGGIENVSRKLKVIDILPPHASGREIVYVPLILLERMEQFKDGFAVPAYEWKGELPTAYPVYYSALLYTKEVLNPILQAQIRQRTGFIKIDDITKETSTKDILNDSTWHTVLLQTGNIPINAFKIKEINNLLRGKEFVLIPMSGKQGEAINIELENASSTVNLELKSTPFESKTIWEGLSYFSLEEEGFSEISQSEWNNPEIMPNYLILSKENAQKFSETKARANIQTPSEEHIDFTVNILSSEKVENNEAYSSVGFVGQLNLLLERQLIINEIEGNVEKKIELLLGRESYSRFRMYAKSLDEVELLAKELEETGLSIKTRSAEIQRVKLMDKYLNIIIGAITSIALIGGAICLLASLYASVERKRRSFAVLRLLGMNATSLCAFPLCASIIMTSLGFLLALLIYHASSLAINSLAQDFTLPGELLCYLRFDQQVYSFILALLAAIIAGITASMRLFNIEPSEGLRDE